MKEWTIEVIFIKPCQSEHVIAKNTMDIKIWFLPKTSCKVGCHCYTVCFSFITCISLKKKICMQKLLQTFFGNICRHSK